MKEFVTFLQFLQQQWKTRFFFHNSFGYNIRNIAKLLGESLDMNGRFFFCRLTYPKFGAPAHFDDVRRE
jgi:hypothetical protein